MGTKDLDFAYRYPFSGAAKRIVGQQRAMIENKYIERAEKHINAARSGSLHYIDVSVDYLKLDYVMTYLYARMLLGAMGDRHASIEYAAAESKRSAEALGKADDAQIAEVAADIGLSIKKSAIGMDTFFIPFTNYISNAPKRPEYALVNQSLKGGNVIVGRAGLIGLVANAAAIRMTNSIMAKSAELPKEIITRAKAIRSAALKSASIAERRGGASKGSEWIEKLIKTPIPDARHRTVNLILAPYLVNIKKVNDDDAVKIISEYIGRCKEIEPNTKVNEQYIRYQCDYARRKGLRPLSFDNAKELIGDYIS